MPTAVTSVVKESTTPTKRFWTWIVLTRRKEDVSREEFARHYHEVSWYIHILTGWSLNSPRS